MLVNETALQNRYRIVRPLGQGGMGAVYEAFDERLRRTVAIKETFAETDQLKRAFEREAHLLANLRHPALPNVLDHFSEGNGLFLVMEYIPGEDLSSRLNKGETFSADQVSAWADQLLDALEYLHSLVPPVLHRDIKPGNLKVVARNQIVLLDFGLAKGVAGGMQHTNTASILGYSPNYSSLEQIQGTGTDPRSDLYSLAATLYHLLTGTKPPDALTRATAVLNSQPDPLRPIGEIGTGIAPAFSATLMRAMALDLNNRPASAEEMKKGVHGAVDFTSATVANTRDDELTRVRTQSIRNAPATAPPRQSHQVVVPVPGTDETLVRRTKSGGIPRAVLIGVPLILAALAVVLYMEFMQRPTPVQKNVSAPVVRRTPQPSPTESINANVEANVNASPANMNAANLNANVEPTPGFDQMSAREKLQQRNIPFTPETFGRAVANGDVSTVDQFLAGGMDPNSRDGKGAPAIVGAAAGGSDEITRHLLRRGADVNAADPSGNTALSVAAFNGHKKTTRVLIDGGANVNSRDALGRTPLMQAAIGGHKDMVKALLDAGAQAGIRDKSGKDAAMWAEINGHGDIADLLRNAR